MTDAKRADIPTKYDPAAIEGPLFESWEQGGYFKRTKGEQGKDPFTVVIPPPNVTGVLHMGHALNGTIQDIIVRRARMQGCPTRWIVGTDHAGIATQNRVEKRLAARGQTRFDVGREQFVQECWKWREEYGNTIISQFRGLGCSCDYSDEKFTMSPEYQDAIRHVFCEWHRRGLIYRGSRIINWCPRCTTALSDAEVEHADEPEDGHLWFIRYPLTTPVGNLTHLTVATTRPETMLGDTAVAVNPNDERYKDVVGATVDLPLVNRQIPVVADDYVDMSYGSGAVKITPAHDPNDFEVGVRHDLPQVNIFDETAHVNGNGGQFAGMERYEAREAVVAKLEELGLLDHIEDCKHSPGHCYRCHTVVEPWLSDQWFVKMAPLAKPAVDAVKNGEIRFTPKRWEATYYAWMENIRDWCISRQLWWGHRIPVFYCDDCGWQDALEKDPDACPKCGSSHIRQDEDVLDTWYSSQLWPFAVLGWPSEDAEADLERYYPTQVLSTAPDILFLWVARMIFAGIDLTGKIPFHDVIYHATVLDKHGDRMSKSKGNGIDPLELVGRFGADATRFHLASHVTGAQSFKLDPERIVNDRNFITKIWNAVRFVQMNLDGFCPGDVQASSAVDKWLLSRLAALVKAMNEALDAFSIAEACNAIYHFFWDEFCDWYVEFCKPRLYGDDEQDRLAAQRNLVFTLDVALRLLHPFMPFVTDELWRALPHAGDAPSLIVARWPETQDFAKYVDEGAEKSVALVCDAVSAVRSTRARYGISPKAPLDVRVKTATEADAEALLALAPLAANMTAFKGFETSSQATKPAGYIAQLSGSVEVFVDVSGLVDIEAERARIQKARDAAAADLEKSEKKLSNQGFLQKAAPAAVAKEQAKHDEFAAKIAALDEQLAGLLG